MVVKTISDRADASMELLATSEELAGFCGELRAWSVRCVAVAWDPGTGELGFVAERFSSKGASVCGVVRGRELMCLLEELLDTRATLVVHGGKEFLRWAWAQLRKERTRFEVQWPQKIFDTEIVARATCLGDAQPLQLQELEKFESRSTASREKDMSLETCCFARSIPLSLVYLSKSLSRTSWKVVSKALWTLRLSDAQLAELGGTQVEQYLEDVEFPFVATNAWIEDEGVHFGADGEARLMRACAGGVEVIDRELSALGQVGTPLEMMQRLVGASTDPEGRLRDVSHRSSEARLLRRRIALARTGAQVSKGLYKPDSNGRVRCNHTQLGTATGRSTTSFPNLAGLPGVLRPAIRAPQVRVLVELDYGQIDVCVAAFLSGDEELITACNSNDAYRQIRARLRSYMPSWLTRDGAKLLVLTLINGGGAGAVARILGMKIELAWHVLQSFQYAFPKLIEISKQGEELWIARRRVEIVPGLERIVAPDESPGRAERIRMNTPIQGLGAVIFKEALNAMAEHFKESSARVVLPLHDGVLIECDRVDLGEVTHTARRIMIDAFAERCPGIDIDVHVNEHTLNEWRKGPEQAFEEYLAAAYGVRA